MRLSIYSLLIIFYLHIKFFFLSLSLSVRLSSVNQRYLIDLEKRPSMKCGVYLTHSVLGIKEKVMFALSSSGWQALLVEGVGACVTKNA